MEAERYARVREVFLAATERPAEQQRQYVLETCGEDDDLRCEVESLMRHHHRSETVIVWKHEAETQVIRAGESTLEAPLHGKIFRHLRKISDETILPRFQPLGVILAVGLIASGILFFLVQRQEHRLKQAEHERDAQHLRETVVTKIQLSIEVFRSLPAFFESSDDVTREEFRSFVAAPGKRNDAIRYFVWAPIIEHEERQAFEETLKVEALAGVGISEAGKDNQLIRTGNRRRYVPVYYLEPGGESLGLDLAIDDRTRAAVDSALENEDMVVTHRFRPWDDPDGQYAVCLFQSVFKNEGSGRVRLGMVGIVLHIPTILEEVLASSQFEQFDIALLDDSARSGQTVLFQRRPGVSETKQIPRLSRTIEVADGKWTLNVWARPESAWESSPAAWSYLAAGVLLTVFACLGFCAVGAIGDLRKSMVAVQQMGQYQIHHVIGQGGMGIVYYATHAMLKRPTAVKVLRNDQTTRESVLRFEREVQQTSRLTHPNTIEIYDYGRAQNREFYYAMEYLQGITLADLVHREGGVMQARSAEILKRICYSLREAHGIGLVHRDIKPANVMLCARGGEFDVVKVLDFGLVKDIESQDQAEITQKMQVSGTPMYMAPERLIEPDKLDTRSDIYSLGALAYKLLSGEDVFESDHDLDVFPKTLSQRPIRLTERTERPIIPELSALVMQCLEKRPDDRPGAVAEILERLDGMEFHPPWTDSDAQKWWRPPP